MLSEKVELSHSCLQRRTYLADEWAFEAGCCTHESKPSVHTPCESKQALNRATFELQAGRCASRKPHGVKIGQGDHDMCDGRCTCFALGREVRLQSGIMDGRYSSARTCFLLDVSLEKGGRGI
jgi:hypothetical protein